MVLTNCLGLSLCDSDIKKINVSCFELEIINSKLKDLSSEKVEKLLLESAEKCINEISINDENLKSYIYTAVKKLSPSIFDAFKINTLNKVFVEFNKTEEENIIEFIDKDKLTNKKFKIITEKIRENNSLEDKISIINENIKSIEDLSDMLDSECLFDDEYEKFFKTLPKIKLILLSKYIDEYGKQSEWVEIFKDFLSLFTEDERKYIEKMKEQLVLK